MLKFQDYHIHDLLNQCRTSNGYKIAMNSFFGESLDATTMALDLKYMMDGTVPTQSEIDFINKHQEPSSGLYQELATHRINEGNYRNLEMSAVYLTYHVSMLFLKFDIKPLYDFLYLKDFVSQKFVDYFMEEFVPWNSSTMGSGNIIDHYVSALRVLARSRPEFCVAIEAIYQHLESIESIDHGFYGNIKAQGLNGLVQGGYHLLRGTYFYDKLPVSKVEKKIDTLIDSYTNLSGAIFKNGQGEGCHDMDHFLLLQKLHSFSDYRAPEIKLIAEERLNQIVSSRTQGISGFAFNLSHSIQNHNRYDVTNGEVQGDLVGTVFYLQTIKSLADILGEQVNWRDSVIHG
jgi:hypothetical protein